MNIRNMVDPTQIGFMKLQVSDLDLMHRWLDTDQLSQWCGERPALDEVVRKYGGKIAWILA
jgi:hypothetical protein